MPPALPTRRPLTRVEHLVAAAGLVQSGLALYEKGRKARDGWRSKRWYVVSVGEDEPIWWDLQANLLDLIADRDQRSLTARYERDLDRPPILLWYDGSKTHTVTIGGHPIRVTVLNGESNGEAVGSTSILDEQPHATAAVSSGGMSRRVKRTIQFDCQTLPARDAVTGWLSDLAAARRGRENPPEFHIVSKWGHWDDLPKAARRDPSTVVLRDGIMEAILADIATFLDSRQRYEEAGIPYHRGYLLHGPPGSGKSSIARAIAAEFNLDLWYVPLGDIPDDANLLQLVASINTGGVLLLEDVDVFNAATSRTENSTKPEASLSGVLNALDGVATPPGLIKIATTNHRERLDPAVTRPGRFDMDILIDDIDDDQARRLFRLVFPDAADGLTLVNPTGRGVSAAEVLEACKPRLDDPIAAADAFNTLVANKANDRLVTTGGTS